MDRNELSIGLLRDKLKEFGDVDHALDFKITEEYVAEPQEQLLEIEEGITRREKKIAFYRHAYALYEKLRFLNFLYYLAPFALVFGVISLLLSSRGSLLIIFSLLALAKYLLGQMMLFRIRKKSAMVAQLEEEKEALLLEQTKRGDEREALLARASILAAEIRYLEYQLQDQGD